MNFNANNIFDTPQLRYVKLRKEFDKKYLNPKAWDHEFDTKERVQAYHDHLKFLRTPSLFVTLLRVSKLIFQLIMSILFFVIFHLLQNSAKIW